MKILGLDVGERTIGVAVSDALHFTAQGIETIKWDESDYESAIPRLKELIEGYEISKIVVGYPKNMNNTVGERAQSSETFAKYIEEHFDIPIVLWDERLTTMAAERVLLEADVSRKKRKK